MADIADVQSRYPTLIDYTDTAQQAILQTQLNDADFDLDEPRWGRLYLRGNVAYAAHRTELVMRTGAADPEAVGGLEANFPLQSSDAAGLKQSFAIPSTTIAEFNNFYSTQPGLDYLELARRACGGPVVI